MDILKNLELSNVENLHEVPNKDYIGYWRMYFNRGWGGRWFPSDDSLVTIDGRTAKNLADEEVSALNNLINAVCDKWKKGCDWQMEYDMEEAGFYKNDTKRFALAVKNNPCFIILFDLTYGNGDYPVRIYFYREKIKNSEEKE